MKKFWLITIMLLWTSSAHAVTRYLDCAVSSSGSGQSWGTAWKAFSNITGLAAGDIVYISGSGTCATYSVNGWIATNGTAGNPITYKIGQDAGHNSPVTLTAGGQWLANSGNITGVVVDGNYNNTRSITVTGSTIIGGSVNGLKLSYLNLDQPLRTGTMINSEIDHNNITLCPNCNWFYQSSASAGAIGYTSNLVHDNTLTLAHYIADGSGDDGFHRCHRL